MNGRCRYQRCMGRVNAEECTHVICWFTAFQITPILENGDGSKRGLCFVTVSYSLFHVSNACRNGCCFQPVGSKFDFICIQ